AREVAFAIAGLVELRDRVLHFSSAGDTKVERREHLAGGAQSTALVQRGDALIVLHDQPPRLIAVRANELGGTQMCITNDDRPSALIEAARENVVAAPKRSHTQHSLVAYANHRSIARERGGRATSHPPLQARPLSYQRAHAVAHA